MPKIINAVQTYTFDVNKDIKVLGQVYISRNGDNWFKYRFSKVKADNFSIKMSDDGFVQMVINASAYITVTSAFEGNSHEVAEGKASFILSFDKYKISDFRDVPPIKANQDADINLEVNFGSELSSSDKDSIAKKLVEIIKNEDFKANIEQTVSGIKYIE